MHDASTVTGELCVIRESNKIDEDGRPYILLWIGLDCVYVFDNEIRAHFQPMRFVADLNRPIALLTRAREIMQGGV